MKRKFSEDKVAKLMLINANGKAPKISYLMPTPNSHMPLCRTYFHNVNYTIAELSSSLFAFFADASLAALLSLIES